VCVYEDSDSVKKGILVDIFPIEYVSDNKYIRTVQLCLFDLFRIFYHALESIKCLIKLLKRL
jgi:phosphorylcholine metabolism protein LicD